MPSSQVMHKFKAGKLKSSSGQKVTSRNQAIAIKLSEEREEKKHGGHYPESGNKKKTSRAERIHKEQERRNG